MQDPASCKEVIQQAKKKGFLPNYLERKITEVENMLCAKYDYDLDIQVKQEEAFANGVKQGIEQGIEKGISQGIEKGITQGCNQERIATAKRMLEKQIDENIISIATKMSIDELQNIKISK